MLDCWVRVQADCVIRRHARISKKGRGFFSDGCRIFCILHHFTSSKFWMEGIFDLGPYQKPYFSAHALFLTLDKICKMPSIRNARLNVMELMDLWSNRFCATPTPLFEWPFGNPRLISKHLKIMPYAYNLKVRYDQISSNQILVLIRDVFVCDSPSFSQFLNLP